MNAQLPTRRFFVITTRACDPCQGGGRVEHPAWKELYRKHPWATLKEMEQFFETTDRKQWPNQWITCLNCHGSGEEQVQVDLVEALAELGLNHVRELEIA